MLYGSQMKINIRVELDGDDLSLEDILAALFHEDIEVPVIETVTPVTEPVEVKEEPKEDIPEKPRRAKRKPKNDAPEVETVEPSTPEPVVEPTKPKQRRRRIPAAPVRRKRKNTRAKAPEEPTLADIGGIVNADRIELLKSKKVNSVKEFASLDLDALSLAMGASENELTDIENAQRVASALLREYRLAVETLKMQVETPAARPTTKKEHKKKEWTDDSAFLLAWEALPHGKAGVHFAHHIAATAVTVAERNYETPDDVADRLTQSAKDIFEKIERASTDGRFQYLDGGGNMVALVVLDNSKWPSQTAVKEA